ncbi:MAG TPA: PAS domain-containing protein, partial [Anaerolineales bacterium]|nr:PAS domain-containing protein [Anaerolineales bacterium]
MSDKHPLPDQFEDFDLRDLPIGVYMTSLDGRFIVCNQTLRKLLELPPDGPINANIEKYYFNPADRKKSIEQAIKLAEQGKHTERSVLHLMVGERDLYVEDYCEVMQNAEGEVIGFMGCMVDVTKDFEGKQREKELRERVEELRFDIGRILHANTTTLVMVKQTLDA